MRRSSSESRPTAVVLGAAHWHAPLYRDSIARRFRLSAVQDADLDTARRFAAASGAFVTADVDAALERDEVDVAFVFSPHDEMLEVGRALIDQRIPFVIEKPGGATLDQLRQLEDDARSADVPVTVSLVQRDAPIETWLRQAGDIIYERLSFIAGPPDRYRRNGNPWMLDARRSGGGSLMNLAPHFVDLAARHIGRPTEVLRKRSTSLHGGAVDDHATMVLTTATGREAIVEVGYSFPESPLKRYCSFTAAGSNGFASVDTTGNATFTANDGTSTDASLDVDSDPLYAVFVDRVADTLTLGFEGLPTVQELLQAMEAIWSPEHAGTVDHA